VKVISVSDILCTMSMKSVHHSVNTGTVELAVLGVTLLAMQLAVSYEDMKRSLEVSM